MRRHLVWTAAAALLLLAGGARASVVVVFICDAEVVSVAGFDETSGQLEMAVRLSEVTRPLTHHDPEIFMENYGGRDLEIALAGLDAETAEGLAAGSSISLEYWHSSGILGGTADRREFSSERWTYLGPSTEGAEDDVSLAAAD